LSEAHLIELVRGGVGVPDLPVRIDGWTRWRATACVAERLQEGRIFIAGDAAHLMPPNGGFGGNTGVHDAHNLAWKLALVLKGHAQQRLLETYALERKPVAEFTVGQAFTRYVLRTAPWLKPTQPIDPQVDDFDIELGYLYGAPDVVHADPRTTRGMPGSRAPHVWLGRPGSADRISTLDLFGNFVLFAGPRGASWVSAAPAVAAEFGHLPLDVYRVGHDVSVVEGLAHGSSGPEGSLGQSAGHTGFCERYGLSDTGATLVRPDGFVAWRAEHAAADPRAALQEALARNLAGR
jgi:putative polyketide hydroxylase